LYVLEELQIPLSVKYNYMCRLHIHQQFSRIMQKFIYLT